MSDSFLDGLVCNHVIGLHQFKAGCYDLAQQSFSHALFLVRHFLQSEEQPVPTLQGRHDTIAGESRREDLMVVPDNEMNFENDFCSFVETSTMNISFLIENSSGTPHDGNLQIFPFPLYLPDQVTVDQYAFIALYNLALSSLLATQSSTESTNNRKLEKALKMWEAIHCTITHSGHDLMLSKTHQLAVLTNMGYLNLATGNRTTAKLCYLYVSDIINSTFGEDSSLNGSGGDVYFRAFFSFIALQGLDVAAAA